MRTGTIVVALAGLVVVAGIAYSFTRQMDQSTAAGPPVAANSITSSRIVHVDELAETPEDFKGEITLRAAVAAVNESEGVFGVIDAREFESCGQLDCCERTVLPIKFAGDLPEPRTVVEITGWVVQSELGLVIDADHIEVVK